MAIDRKNATKPVTIKDVAAHLGIAFSTVSRALHSDHHVSASVRTRVQEAVEQLGYVPNTGARMMHRKHSMLIGLVIPDFQNQLFWATARVLATRCNAAGYELILGVSGDDPEIELRQVVALRSARAAGIVIAASGRSLDRTIELLRTEAVVQLAARDPNLPFPTVTTNDHLSLESSTRHLLQLGHSRIGYIGGRLSLGTADQRFSGYAAALEASGIVVDDEIVFRGPLDSDFARVAMTRLLQASNPPTAVAMSNSLQTEGAIEALRDAGIEVPGQLSLVGYGDPSWFHLWGPGITTVDAREIDLADAAATLLMEQVGKGVGVRSEKPLKLVINTRLILRGTTGPPRASQNWSAPAVSKMAGLP